MERGRFYWKSPGGWMKIELYPDSLLWLGFVKTQEAENAHQSPDRAFQPLLSRLISELSDYFSGKRKDFSVPTCREGSPFELAVWQALQAIPYGETRTYGEIAERIGRPKAARAAGSAIGRNPLSILIPCHRVVRKNGRLGGYAGGLEAKRFLLEMEKRHEALSIGKNIKEKRP